MEDQNSALSHQLLKTLLGGEKEALELLRRAYVHRTLYVAASELVVETAVDYNEVWNLRRIERTRLALVLVTDQVVDLLGADDVVSDVIVVTLRTLDELCLPALIVVESWIDLEILGRFLCVQCNFEGAIVVVWLLLIYHHRVKHLVIIEIDFCVRDCLLAVVGS